MFARPPEIYDIGTITTTPVQFCSGPDTFTFGTVYTKISPDTLGRIAEYARSLDTLIFSRIRSLFRRIRSLFAEYAQPNTLIRSPDTLTRLPNTLKLR